MRAFITSTILLLPAFVAALPTPQFDLVQKFDGTTAESDAEAEDLGRVTCNTADDCTSFCQTVTAGNADVAQFGLASTCISDTPLGVSFTAPGACFCSSGSILDEAAIALGETACLAVQDAIPAAALIVSSVIPFAAADSAASGLFKAGSKILKKGTKDCSINPCGDHVFTVVDPDDVQAQAGILAC